MKTAIKIPSAAVKVGGIAVQVKSKVNKWSLATLAEMVCTSWTQIAMRMLRKMSTRKRNEIFSLKHTNKVLWS